jgi:hypothetical protein
LSKISSNFRSRCSDSSSAFQNITQLLKRTFNFSTRRSITVRVDKRPNYQRGDFPVLVLFWEGGIGLDDFEAASERVEEILRNETPLNRKGGHIHSDTAKKFFGRIKSLRGRGFSFIQLCAAFEKAGILPEESNPYSLRQAFLREAARRDKAEELLKAVKDTASEEAAAPSPKADMPVSASGGETAKDEAAEKEWIRKQLSTPVDTGLGKITKNSDGSFDYN